MKFSSIPLIFIAIAGFWWWAARAARMRGDMGPMHVHAVTVWLALLAGWGAVTSSLSIRGSYSSHLFYSLLPGLWVPLDPVVLSLVLLWAWPTFRTAAWVVTSTTLPRAFLFMHAVRILAIGGIFKVSQGLLPGSFVYPVGIPDFLFGLTSLVLAIRYPPGGYSRPLLIGWNLAGIGVLLSAPILMQLGLPGPFHAFATQPDARALFEFPMVLAPRLVVTLLFFMNGWRAYELWRQARQPSPHPVLP